MKKAVEPKKAIKKKAKSLGADLVSFLNLSDYHSPASPDPQRYLKGAKSVVLLAFRPLAGAYEYGENTWSKMPSYLYCVESAANTAAYHLGKYIEDGFGGKTFVVQAHRPFELTEETYRKPVGAVSLRHVAVRSGMAVWGRNTLALTPEYGAKVMYIGLLNTLDLESDSPIEGYDPCAGCGYDCVGSCPGRAFTDDGRVISHRCVRTSQPDDVGNFMRFVLEVVQKPGLEEKVEMIRGPRLFRHLQYLQFFIHYHCDACTRACPGSRM
ncbi:MAG: hypothetical protein AB1742_07395 [bacterium]